MKMEDSEIQAHLAAIVTYSDDVIVSKDLNGNITSWNPAAERIFGYTAEEAVGKHISLIIPPDRLSEEDFIIGKIRNGERLDHFDTLRRTKDGRLIHLSVTISPIRNGNGRIIGASKIARDVTALREAEKASAYLAAIIESSEDAIISKDLNGFITSWNKGAERIFGYNTEEIVGRHVTTLIPTDLLSEEEKIIGSIRNGRRVEHFETKRRHKNGHLIPVSITVSPIRDGRGKLIGASKIARDIGDRIRVENELAGMARKKDEFLANMSHELRTPMNAVIGLANLLKASELPERAAKFVDTLKMSADNLMDLINDLLDFAKIDSDLLEIEQAEFNLAEQIERAVSLTNVKAREKGLVFYIRYPPELNRYYIGDPLRIQQIIMNLLSNAVKFTDKGSVEVDLSGTIDPDTQIVPLTIKVTDTGIGIPKDKLGIIFDKFSQADSSITRRYGGSGLGLSIVKALVEKMNGSIRAESVEGLGASFILTIPLKATNRPSTIESFSASAAPEFPTINKNVLLVEDYEPNVIVAEALLQEMGCDYDVAANGFEALRKFVHGRYDIVLMDIQMHELDGLEATRRIRKFEAERSLQRTPIIAMTAHATERDKDKCLDAGMDDFVAKPFNPVQLVQKIKRFIHSRELNTPDYPDRDEPKQDKVADEDRA